MSTKKKLNPEESSTSVPNSLRDRKRRRDHERLLTLSRRYYTKNEFTSPLEALVIAVTETEWVRSEWVQSSQALEQDPRLCKEGTELTIERLEDELVAEWEHFYWMSHSGMLRRVANLIAEGDTKGLQEFASAQASYEEGLKELTYKGHARLFLMVACEELRSWRTREEVTKAEIRDLACELWAKYNLNHSGKPNTAANIQYAVKRLPTVDWPLIFREVGLDDIRSSKPGRKPIGNKTWK